MLAQISHLLGVITEEQTFPSRLFRTAALSLGYMAPDVAWVGGHDLLGDQHETNPKTFGYVWKESEVPQLFQVPNLDF